MMSANFVLVLLLRNIGNWLESMRRMRSGRRRGNEWISLDRAFISYVICHFVYVELGSLLSFTLDEVLKKYIRLEYNEPIELDRCVLFFKN